MLIRMYNHDQSSTLKTNIVSFNRSLINDYDVSIFIVCVIES